MRFVRLGFLGALFQVLLIISTAGVSLAGPASAAPEMVTDRPDQTESSSVVPPGYAQLEVGWTFTRNDIAGTRVETHAFPGTLLRLGALPRVVIRLGWDGGIWEQARSGVQRTELSGAGDMGIGAKFYGWEEQGWIPEMALLGGVSLPVGSDEFSSGRADPDFRVSLSHTLSDRLSLGYNLGASWPSAGEETSDRLSLFLYTAALGISLSERAGMFLELFGDIPIGVDDGEAAHSFDGGFTYLLRDNVQLDAAGGVEISESADDWFVGLGISVRFLL